MSCLKEKNKMGKKKDWLDLLLMDNFGNCKNHQEKFNEKNMFCLDCGISLCRHGKELHSLHQKFQVYKYCYQDVVKYSDLLKVFDCSNIQTYISNNDKIVHLKPRPLSKEKKLSIRPKITTLSNESQVKETKTSTTPLKLHGGICEECGKLLQDKRNRFCSIRCKISIEEVRVNQNNHNQNSEAKSSITMSESYECVKRMNFRKWQRKNVPIRSISCFVVY